MTWKKWLKRTLGYLVGCLVLGTVWLVGERAWQRSAGERDFATAVAETERTDPDWRWEALNAKRPRPPAGKNGAALIPRIKNLIPNRWGQNLYGREVQTLIDIPANCRFPEAVRAELLREITGAWAAVELARSLKDYPSAHREIRLAPDLMSTQLDDTDSTRTVGCLLRWEIAAAVEDGDVARTADGLSAMLNASRSIGDEPLLISQLARIAIRMEAVRSAERALAHVVVPAEHLSLLRAAWAADAEEPLFLYGVFGERAAFDVLMANLADGSVTRTMLPTPEAGGSLYEDYVWWRFHVCLPQHRAFIHRWLSGVVKAARLPVHAQPAAIKALEQQLPEPRHKNPIFARFVVPPILFGSAAYWRGTAETRCTALAFACEQFRLKTGNWPKDLPELSPEFLPSGVPPDPFDGKPLRYRKLDDGVVIYSIGKDQTDDGGNIGRINGVSPPDLGFRLWDIAHRRQPASPRPVPPEEPKEP